MPLDEQSILSTFDGKIDKKRDVDITKSHQYKIMYTSSRDVVDKIKSKAEKAPEKERDGDSYKSYHSDSQNSGDEAHEIILKVNKYQDSSKKSKNDVDDIELGEDSNNESQSKKSNNKKFSNRNDDDDANNLDSQESQGSEDSMGEESGKKGKGEKILFMESKWKQHHVKNKLKDMDFQMDDEANSDEWQPSSKKPSKKKRVKTAEDYDREYDEEINNKDAETGSKMRGRRGREIGEITPV